MTVMYIILALAGTIAVLVIFVAVTVKKLKKAQLEIRRLSGAFEAVQKKVERLQKVQKKEKEVTEDANEKRKALNGTCDDGLVTRANGLFSGGVSNSTGAD